jgi:hypothetical protein
MQAQPDKVTITLCDRYNCDPVIIVTEKTLQEAKKEFWDQFFSRYNPGFITFEEWLNSSEANYYNIETAFVYTDNSLLLE